MLTLPELGPVDNSELLAAVQKLRLAIIGLTKVLEGFDFEEKKKKVLPLTSEVGTEAARDMGAASKPLVDNVRNTFTARQFESVPEEVRARNLAKLKAMKH